MNKKGKYAGNGALFGSVVNALLNGAKQLKQMDANPHKKFDWGELLGAGVKGAAVGGASGFVVGAIKDYQNANETPINTDEFLFNVVNEVKLDKNEISYKRLDQKAAKLIEILKFKLRDKLSGEPMRLGSTEKGTALSTKYDIDICLPFKPTSFSSTGDMFEVVLNILDQLVGTNSIILVRDQKKSIGVILELQGEEHKIDIVPYKITKSPSNKTSGYLYLNDSSNPSYTKTDIHALRSFKLTETQKKIAIILKHWKTKNNLPISSYLLENLIVDAYKHNEIPRNFTKKVIMVLQHIHDHLDVAVIKSVENTNNILTDISESKKNVVIGACKIAIEEYVYQPNAVLDIFEVND